MQRMGWPCGDVGASTSPTIFLTLECLVQVAFHRTIKWACAASARTGMTCPLSEQRDSPSGRGQPIDPVVAVSRQGFDQLPPVRPVAVTAATRNFHSRHEPAHPPAIESAQPRPLNCPGPLGLFLRRRQQAKEAGLKRSECIVEILEAFDLAGSYRAAAELALLAPHRRAVCRLRASGRVMTERAVRDPADRRLSRQVEEWVERSHGRSAPDVAHDSSLLSASRGSERTTRRGGCQRQHALGRASAGVIGVDPGARNVAQFDWGHGPRSGGREAMLLVRPCGSPGHADSGVVIPAGAHPPTMSQSPRGTDPRTVAPFELEPHSWLRIHGRYTRPMDTGECVSGVGNRAPSRPLRTLEAESKELVVGDVGADLAMIARPTPRPWRDRPVDQPVPDRSLGHMTRRSPTGRTYRATCGASSGELGRRPIAAGQIERTRLSTMHLGPLQPFPSFAGCLRRKNSQADRAVSVAAVGRFEAGGWDRFVPAMGSFSWPPVHGQLTRTGGKI